MSSKLRIGLIGLGRLGRVYAGYLANRVPSADLVAVADTDAATTAAVAQELGVPQHFTDYHDLLGCELDAVAVLTPTSTHKQVVLDAAHAGKAVFCEKPIAMNVEDAQEMIAATQKAGVPFQPAFQRRFDKAYVNAKKQVEAGVIGTPVAVLSISRDPFRPSLEFCNRARSGGLINDMCIHEFDFARWFMGEVKSVAAIGGTLAYPEMKEVGDIDNAMVHLTFESGTLGSVHVSRNAVFGYDLRSEIWGTKGSLQIGYQQQTPVVTLTKEGITHDALPYFMERFEDAYLAQIQNFVDAVLHGAEPVVSGRDAIEAIRVGLAATKACDENRIVAME